MEGLPSRWDELLEEIQREAYFAVEKQEYPDAPVLETVLEEEEEVVQDAARRFPSLIDRAAGFAERVKQYENSQRYWTPYGADLTEALPEGMVRFESDYPVFDTGSGDLAMSEFFEHAGPAAYRSTLVDADGRLYENIASSLQGTVPEAVTYWDETYPGWANDLEALLGDSDALFASVFREKGKELNTLRTRGRTLMRKIPDAKARERAELYAEEYGGVSFPWRE